MFNDIFYRKNTLEMSAEMSEIAVFNDFAPFLFCCVNSEVLMPRYFSLGAVLPQKNTLTQNSYLRF